MVDESRRPVYKIGSPVLFTVCLIVIALVGWGTTYVGCTENQGVREALIVTAEQDRSSAERAEARAKVDVDGQRELDLRAAASLRRASKRASVRPLECFPLPSNGP